MLDGGIHLLHRKLGFGFRKCRQTMGGLECALHFRTLKTCSPSTLCRSDLVDRGHENAFPTPSVHRGDAGVEFEAVRQLLVVQLNPASPIPTLSIPIALKCPLCQSRTGLLRLEFPSFLTVNDFAIIAISTLKVLFKVNPAHLDSQIIAKSRPKPNEFNG